MVKKPYNSKPAGRKSGSKNLIKVNNRGRVENQHGVQFTKGEQEKLVKLANQANYKRGKLLKYEESLPLYVAGQDMHRTLGETFSFMGRESDFIHKSKQKGLQRFKDRKSFDHYIKSLERVLRTDYEAMRGKQYKDNHIKSIKEVFGAESKAIVKRLKAMPVKQYMDMVRMDEHLTIDYVDTDRTDAEAFMMTGLRRHEQLAGITTSLESFEQVKGIGKYAVDYNPKFGETAIIKKGRGKR